MLTIIFSVVFFLVIIMMLGCAHCLRAIYDVSDGRPSGALGRIKQSGLSKSKYGSSERKIPTVREPPTLEGAQLSRHKSVPSFPVIGHEDLQDMKMAHPLGDACYFSDAYSFSDTNPSPRESPLSTPRSTRMALHRMHSTGITLFQPSVEQISEGLPLHDNTRRHSVETFQSTLSNKLRGRGFPKRSVSVPDMAEQLEPKIEFDMAFSQETLTLFVENVKVTDLVIDQNRGYAYVNIDILPASKAQRTTLWNVSSCLNFDERVCFENLSQTDLHKCMLLLTVFYTLSKGKRGTSLGEVLVNISEQLDAAQSKVVVTRSLQIGRRQRKVLFFYCCVVVCLFVYLFIYFFVYFFVCCSFSSCSPCFFVVVFDVDRPFCSANPRLFVCPVFNLLVPVPYPTVVVVVVVVVVFVFGGGVGGDPVIAL